MSCMSETCPSGIPHVRSTRTVALARTVQELEEHQSHRGWDAPVAVFALVRTADALEVDPELATLLEDDELLERVKTHNYDNAPLPEWGAVAQMNVEAYRRAIALAAA